MSRSGELLWERLWTNMVKNIKTQIMFNNIFFVNEIMWKNIVETDRPQVTIWRMRIACWITKATNTRSEYVILIAFPR